MALTAYPTINSAQHRPQWPNDTEHSTQSSWSEAQKVTAFQNLSTDNLQRTGSPFFVPTNILEKQDKARQLRSFLVQLPIEILLLIVEKISAPYFQVSLGLTCKAVASIIFENQQVLTKWRGYRDKEGLYRLLTKIPPCPASKLLNNSTFTSTVSRTQSIESETPPTKPSTSPQPYIPSHLRLCRACFRHVPRDLSYWSIRMSADTFDEPGTNWYDIFNFFEEGWRGCGQHRCPDCVVRGYLCFMNEATYKTALQDDEEDARWYGFNETGNWEKEMVKTSWRRVCPELPGRLKRP